MLLKKLGYKYVEIVQPTGKVITLEEFNNIKLNFLLFAGDNYYPRGGYADLIAKAATEDELRDIIKENPHAHSLEYVEDIQKIIKDRIWSAKQIK